MSAGLRDNGWKWKGSMVLTHVGMIGMTIALLIAGYEQAFVERAMGGSTWIAYFEGQTQPWFIQAMWWRTFWGIIMTVGVLLLLWDFLRIGAGETRPKFELGTTPDSDHDLDDTVAEAEVEAEIELGADTVTV